MTFYNGTQTKMLLLVQKLKANTIDAYGHWSLKNQQVKAVFG